MPEFHGKRTTNDVLLAKASTRWKSLRLYNTSVDDDGIVSLCDVATGITEFCAESKLFTDRAMASLCTLPDLRSLLLYSAPQITDSGVRHLHQASELRELYLENCQLTDKGVDSFLDRSELWSLKLSGTRLSSEGVSKLGQLRELRLLTLNQIQFDGTGLETLPNEERMSLYLEHCPITDAGIAQYLETHSLIEMLSLSGTRITDTTVAKLTKLQHLAEVRLSNTSISQESLRAFIGHPSLSEIYIAGIDISPELIQELKNAAPKHLSVFQTQNYD